MAFWFSLQSLTRCMLEVNGMALLIRLSLARHLCACPFAIFSDGMKNLIAMSSVALMGCCCDFGGTFLVSVMV